jgi:cold shock CspA family protein
VQGSVHRFDPQTGAGSVLLDDGTEIPFDGDTFERSGLRALRIGQRLTVTLADDRVVDMHLLGI